MGLDVDIDVEADVDDDELTNLIEGSGSGETGDYTTTLGAATFRTADKQTSDSEDFSALTLSLIVAVSAAILVALLVIVVFYCRRRRAKQRKRKTMNISMMSSRNNDVISPFSTSGRLVQTDSKGRQLQYQQLDPRELMASDKQEYHLNVLETSEIHVYERVV